MSRNIAFLGISGLVIFVFGLITRFMVSYDQYFFWELHLLIGGLLIAIFIARGGLPIVGSAATRKAAGLGIGLAVYSVLFFLVLALVNYLVYGHDPLHYDSTEQKVYTLAPQTEKVLEGLKNPVVIRAFFVAGDIEPPVRDLLDRLTKASSKIRWELIDPEKKPALVQKYGINERGTLHFSFDISESTREAKISRMINEQEVVNAILKLSRGGERNVYCLTGHGESDLREKSEGGFLFLREAIQGENFVVKPLELSQEKAVPADASALLIMAPRKALLTEEVKAIRSYLALGGNALLLSEPNTTRDLANLVRPLGIQVGDDVILDETVQLFSGPTVGVQPVVNKYNSHGVTKGFTEAIVFSTVASVTAAKDVPPGVTVTELAFTSEKSWAEKKLNLVFSESPQAAKDAEDLMGPVSIAAAFEGTVKLSAEEEKTRTPKPVIINEPARQAQGLLEPAAALAEETAQGDSSEAKPPKSRVVVVGDADFVANVNIRQLYNRDFFLNALNWVVGEEEGVSIRSKTMRGSTKKLSTEQFRAIFIATVIFMPEILLLLGLTVWWRRR